MTQQPNPFLTGKERLVIERIHLRALKFEHRLLLDAVTRGLVPTSATVAARVIGQAIQKSFR